MPKIKLPDLTDVEDPGNFNDMPKGLYVLKIREMSEGETGDQSKFPGQPMGVVVLDPVRIVGGAKVKKGEYQGLFHRFPLDDQNPGWTPRLREFVKAIGGKLKGGVIDPKAVEGKLVIGKVKDGKSEDGERRAELDKLMPYTEDAAGEDADDDDDDGDGEDLWTEEELGELSSSDLREAAEELEVEVPKKLTTKNKQSVIDAILEAQEEGDEDEDEDGEDSEDEPWDEETLLELGKDELAEAAAEFEVEMPGRLTAAAKKRVVAAILEAQNGDEDDEDEEGDEEEYTEDDLNELTLADLKTVATDEFELDVPKGKAAVVKKKLVAAILEAQEEAGDEDEDEEDEDDDGYDDMTKTQLAKEVRSRNGKVKKGMTEDDMKEWLREQDGEGDDDDEDEELDPEEMDLDEIKAALRERGITVKGSEKMLRAKLVKALEADDDGDPF